MDVGLYVHVPFCSAKCAYCDFASLPGMEWLMPAYGEAVAAELRRRPGLPSDAAGESFTAATVYVGGGTPSTLPLDILARVLAVIREVYAPPAGAEITVEINPGTVDLAYLEELRRLDVRRLSAGVQSLDDDELRLLGRIHDRRQAILTLEMARVAGFDDVNLDLIFGLPGQTMATWETSVSAAIALAPAHISMYALSVEEGTPIAGRIAAGELPAPDPDLAAEMYLRADELVSLAGYEQYEISNWARPGRASRHNLHTWRNGDYLGFGPAAHSHLGRRRWWNVADPAAYVERMAGGASPVDDAEELDEATDMAETMILGLRLVREGVEVERFRRRYGRTPAEVYGAVLEELAALGLLEIVPLMNQGPTTETERMRLTPRGRLLGNQVFARFVGE